MGYAAVIEEFSTITAKGQTTVPKPIRQALGVDEGDKIAFRVDDNGVTIRRAEQDHNDPLITSFLTFLAHDIEKKPEALQGFSSELINRAKSLIDGVKVDLDEPIEGEVDL